MLIVTSLVLIVLGMVVGRLFAPAGILIMALGLILYFASLGHFPANSRVRKHLQAQFDRYYSQRGN